MPSKKALRKDVVRYERWRWQIFFITWLTYAAYYLTRKSFAVAKVAFTHDPTSHIELTRVELGYIDSTQLLLYALGQFLWGPLGDCLGPKKVLMVGPLISIGAALASGFATGFLAFAVFAAIQGIGQSTGWSATVKTMSSWFSVRERGRVMGWWCTNYAVGAAIATPFAAWVMVHWGTANPSGGEPAVFPFWPAGFWVPAFVLLGVFVLVVLLHRDAPADVGLSPIERYQEDLGNELGTGERQTDEEEGSWAVVGQVLRQPAVWILGFSYFAIKLTRYALDLWGPKYVSESLVGSDTLTSAITAAALPIGGVLGVLVSGYLSDWFFQSRRVPVTVVFLLGAAGCMFVAKLGHISHAWSMALYFGAIGFLIFGPDATISATAAMDFGTARGAGTAAGFINGVGSIGSILGGYLPGRITTETNWEPLFWTFIGGLLISACILLPLWKTMPPTAKQGAGS